MAGPPASLGLLASSDHNTQLQALLQASWCPRDSCNCMGLTGASSHPLDGSITKQSGDSHITGQGPRPFMSTDPPPTLLSRYPQHGPVQDICFWLGITCTRPGLAQSLTRCGMLRQARLPQCQTYAPLRCRRGFANPIDLTVAFRPQRDEVLVHLLERQTNFARYLGLYCGKYVPQEERLKGSSWQGEVCP